MSTSIPRYKQTEKPPSIQLTEQEQSLKQLLLDVAVSKEPASELRFTGGWVRDKLLGINSDDIDVAINDMTGEQFGLKVQEQLSAHGEKYNLNGKAGGLHKILKNPEKSKHLETITTKLFGLHIDLVNLRKEKYAADSRTPQVEFGTPEEDALRRDATVNALFYNLHTSQVEDFTHRGLQDLEHGIMRTPLEPYQTFEDDPLRIMRLIRFASKFEYEIETSAKEAMKDPNIRKALKLKISRERIGVELEKMLKGPHPLAGLALIDKLGLYTTIFVDPEKSQVYEPETANFEPAYESAQAIVDTHRSKLSLIFEAQPGQDYLVWLLSAMVPWADAPAPPPSKPGGKTNPPVAYDIARNGIKTPNKIAEVVRDATSNAEDIISKKDSFLRTARSADMMHSGQPGARDTLGMVIRKWGPSWKSQVAFAMMLDAVRNKGVDKDVYSEYAKFLSHIQSLNIQNAYEFKHIIDGKVLRRELGLQGGPWLKDALEEVMVWQLGHPDDATPQAALEAVRSKKGELCSRLTQHFLSLTIRPLFAQTKSSSELGITPQGRRVTENKTTENLPRRRPVVIDTWEEAEAKRPWKQPQEAYALDLLEWCLSVLEANPGWTEKFWPLVVPPLFALVDDVGIQFKIKGCKMLSALFKATPPALMQRTGLRPVFQKAIEPCLSFLPSLTPEHESIEILEVAYPAMIDLANVRVPPGSDQAKSPQVNLTDDRERHLVDLLHNHVLASLSLVSTDTYPALSGCLLDQMRMVMWELKIATVGQLMHIVPALKELLGTPFASASPPFLKAAARAMQTVIATSWPRIWRWRAECLHGLCTAWLAVADDVEGGAGDNQALGEVQLELDRCVQLLLRAIEADCLDDEVPNIDFKAELRGLIDANARLGGLFKSCLEEDGPT